MSSIKLPDVMPEINERNNILVKNAADRVTALQYEAENASNNVILARKYLNDMITSESWLAWANEMIINIDNVDALTALISAARDKRSNISKNT